MRLIDADTFKEYICNAYEQVKHMYPDGGEWARQITEDFCKDIDEQPTIDISNNSNTLGALDCIDRQEAIKALCREECGMDPKGCCVGTCYDVEIIEDVPSVQLELSNNSPELDNKNGESISRQAAIDLVKSFYKIDKSVLKIMVFKLKQLPSVQPETNCSEIPNNSDLISRQAAIDALDKRFDSVPMEQTTEILMLRKDLRELPSSQPRKGKWIRTRTMTHDGELYCDQCEQEHPEQKIIWNFCPNCGCRMKEGDSDE